jgi:hypothetical protein
MSAPARRVSTSRASAHRQTPSARDASLRQPTPTPPGSLIGKPWTPETRREHQIDVEPPLPRRNPDLQLLPAVEPQNLHTTTRQLKSAPRLSRHPAARGGARSRRVRQVQDTSRQGRYHNTRYRALAEELGLTVTQVAGLGWSGTNPLPAATVSRCDICPNALRRRERSFESCRGALIHTMSPSRHAGRVIIQVAGMVRSVRTIQGCAPPHCDARREPCGPGFVPQGWRW